MRIVALADTHGRHRDVVVPAGDLLIHAGDLTRAGDLDELRDVNAWLGALPHTHKVVIAGNHDWCCEREPNQIPELLSHATYLCGASVLIAGWHCYGAPWTPGPGWAFGRSPLALHYAWAQLPAAIDILISHGPPLGARDQNLKGEHLGDPALADAVLRLQPRPQLHIFGHIHEARGCTEAGGTMFANASICDLHYRPQHAPLVFDLPARPARMTREHEG
ncbi:MAG: metallophosphoesterase [Chloroflexales bacterium]|nr:metallophosphoesterase [Chloroflexales bacterium]